MQRLAECVLVECDEGVGPGWRGLISPIMSHLVKKGIDLDDKASVSAEMDRSWTELRARWRRTGIPERVIRSTAKEMAKDFYFEMMRLAESQDK
jgi:hypothetical protein